MLFHWTTTLLHLLLFCACAMVKGQRSYSEEYINEYKYQINQHLFYEPEAYNSCCLNHSNKLPNLFVICPKEFNCYVKPEFSLHYKVKSYDSNSTPKKVCKTLNGQQLSANKQKQLNGVLSFFRLTNDSECAFSSIKQLTAFDNIFHRVLKLDNAKCDSGCLPYELKSMRFGYFNIGHLSNNSFCQLGQLEYLEMFECGISTISENAFLPLVSLKNVVLKRNKLAYLPANLFRNNVHLRSLDLSDNQLRKIDFSTDHVTLQPSLIELNVGGNKLQRLTSELWNLRNLVKLQMHNNGVTNVDEYAFRDLREVKDIDLQWNEIQQLSVNTFKNTSKLGVLKLNANKLSKFPPVAHLEHLVKLDLSNNRISSINKPDLVHCMQLSSINLSNNQLSFIEKGSFVINGNHPLNILYNVRYFNVAHNNLTSFSFQMVLFSAHSVNFSHNKIETIENYNLLDFFFESWSMTKLDLSHNRIRSIDNLKLPHSIKAIDLSYNQITHGFFLPNVIDQRLDNLRSIDLQANNISSLCHFSFENIDLYIRLQYYVAGNPLQCTGELLWVKNPPNRYGILFADLNRATCHSTWPYDDGQLVHIHNLNEHRFLSRSDHANSNRCLCPEYDMKCHLNCPYNCTCLSDYHKQTIYLMCDSKRFMHIPSDLPYINEYYNKADITLEFGRNFISHVSPLDFEFQNENIVALHLANCHIKFIDTNAFNRLSYLEHLNLANNQLETLPEGLFHKLTKLVTLNLANNRLTHLADDAFSSLVNLNHLHLHNNSLNHLQFNQIARLNSLENITLYNNPWSCDCTFIGSFKELLISSPKKVDNKLTINCTENGKQFTVSNYNMDHCSSQINLTILITFLVFGSVLVIISGLLFKWRYELQVLVYSRYGLRLFHKRQPEEEVQGKLFDAFMAYNSKDEDFLVEQLLPGLEGIENPYRILIHERDFLAGGYIQDNIIEAVKLSSRTIVILSKNFVQSGWCRYEFKTAHAQMMEDRCPRVLVIIVGEIPNTLDPEMELYLKTNTYLRWGERLFWQKLYYAMPDLRVTTSPTDDIPMQEL